MSFGLTIPHAPAICTFVMWGSTNRYQIANILGVIRDHVECIYPHHEESHGKDLGKINLHLVSIGLNAL